MRASFEFGFGAKFVFSRIMGVASGMVHIACLDVCVRNLRVPDFRFSLYISFLGSGIVALRTET